MKKNIELAFQLGFRKEQNRLSRLNSVFEKKSFLKKNRVESAQPDVRKKKRVDSAAASTRIFKKNQVMWAASTRVSRKKEELNCLNSVCGKKIELQWVSSTLF